MLVAPVAMAAPTPVSALLVGDSLAFQLGPRLAKAMNPKRLAFDAKGGSSARQWLREGWFRRAVERHPSALTLVSLGVNCTKSERPKLAAAIEALASLVKHGELVWLLPPPLRFDTQYLRDAVVEAGVTAIEAGPLPLESDGVHPTFRGHELWATALVEALWGEEREA